MIYELDDDEENWLQGVADMRMVKESPTSSAVHVDSLMGNQGGSPRKRKRKKEGLVDAIESLEKAENVPVDKELYARVKAEAKKKFDVYPSAYANAWLVREYKSRGGTYRIEKADSPAWQREAGKNPKGGLNAKGRASYKRETGGTLRPPVKRGDNPRRASFLARMGNMAGPERDANGEPTRLLLSLQAWGANSKAEARKKAKAISARNENKDKSVEKQAIDKIIEIKIEMRKASFASRSEAGRYAATERWKGHVKGSKTDLTGGDDTKYSDGMSNGMTDQEKQLHELAVKTDTEIARLQDIGFKLSMSQQQILESITKDYKSEGLREKNEGESVFRYNDYLKQERADQLKVLHRNLRNPLMNAEAVAKLIANFKAQPVRANGTIPDVEYMISQMNDGLGKLGEVGQQINANNALLAPLNKVFAENGWSRFFLVTNTNGHIHKSMDCSTTFPTTDFAWITNLSGLKESHAVAQEGEILCTHCFSSAPSEWTSGESRPKRIAREARAQEKKIRDEKKLAKLLTANGEDLILRGDGYEEQDRQTGLMIPKVKSERLSTVFGGKEFLRDYHDFVLAARKTTEPKRKAWMTNGTDGLHTKENADLVASLVAQKTGKTVEEVMANALRLAEKSGSWSSY